MGVNTHLIDKAPAQEHMYGTSEGTHSILITLSTHTFVHYRVKLVRGCESRIHPTIEFKAPSIRLHCVQRFLQFVGCELVLRDVIQVFFAQGLS